MSNAQEQPTVLVIFGITGDLARRKLLPALCKIARAGALPEQFHILGVSRQRLAKHEVLAKKHAAELEHLFEIYHMDMADPAAYHDLSKYLDETDKHFGGKAQRLFYLSVPPQVTQSIVSLLGKAGLFTSPRAKLLLEKPFGSDLVSAKELIADIMKYCAEEQVYRIDHYMAKEMAQNIVVFRSDNSLFRHTWDKNYIERIEIIMSETLGIEGRSIFYEQTGALRDVLQNHLLQLAALVLMDVPESHDWHAVPMRRLRALEALQPPEDIGLQVRRGQYRGYREEVGNPSSQVETYVSVCVYSNDPQWEGVPITLTTGKRLDVSETKIILHYRQEDARHSNQLILRIQPDEGVTFHVWIKKPGYDQETQQLPLELDYDNHFKDLPDAYERVFVDAIRSEHALFTASSEVLEAWRILAPIQHAWEMTSSDLVFYEPGTMPGTEK